MIKYRVILLLGALIFIASAARAGAEGGADLATQNKVLFRQLQQVHGLSDTQMKAVQRIFTRSGYMGQGNPAVTKHPSAPQECEENLRRTGISYENPRFTQICGAKYMAPLYNPAVSQPEDARVCIDQFEFPNIPCAYPVVWVRAREAAELCEALGKRLCDAHEWEGACAGSLEEPDYRFDLAIDRNPEDAIRIMRDVHNKKYSSSRSWSYGPEYRTGICATSSHKSPG
jgi:hypothetical protein